MGAEKMTGFLFQLLRVYAASGFILSLILHTLAIVGLQPNNNAFLFGPGFAIFPLWLPVTRFSMRLTRGLGRKEAWKAMISGCPKWMKFFISALYWYAIVNLALAMIIVVLFPFPKSSPESAPRFFWILASSYYMFLFCWPCYPNYRQRERCADMS